MARARKEKKKEESPTGPCRTCVWMHIPHERSQVDGEPFLCKCKLKMNDAKDKQPPEGPLGWSEFLDKPCPYKPSRYKRRTNV